jgi:hypothetical protein
MRLALAARPDILKALRRPVAYREHVVLADEHIDFPDEQFTFVVELDGMEHREERIAVLLDLRPLMAVLRVLDGEFVQAELLRHVREFARAGLLQRDPDEAVGQVPVSIDFVDLDVGELAAVLIGRAIDQHV